MKALQLAYKKLDKRLKESATIIKEKDNRIHELEQGNHSLIISMRIIIVLVCCVTGRRVVRQDRSYANMLRRGIDTNSKNNTVKKQYEKKLINAKEKLEDAYRQMEAIEALISKSQTEIVCYPFIIVCAVSRSCMYVL